MWRLEESTTVHHPDELVSHRKIPVTGVTPGAPWGASSHMPVSVYAYGRNLSLAGV